MRKTKVKKLRKEFRELKDNKVSYNIKSKIVEGVSFRKFKKLNK